MGKIIITGRGAVSVPRRVAQEVFNFKLDNTMLPNAIYSRDGLLFEKRDIKAVIVNDPEDNASESSDAKKEGNEQYYIEQEKEYLADIRRKCLTHPQEKAKNIIQYEGIYRSFGKEPTPEFFQEVRNRQLAYYQANPRHPFAIVEIKDLLPELGRVAEMKIEGMLPHAMIRHAYQSMYMGLSTARTLKLI